MRYTTRGRWAQNNFAPGKVFWAGFYTVMIVRSTLRVLELRMLASLPLDRLIFMSALE